jgi:hypothetical protein
VSGAEIDELHESGLVCAGASLAAFAAVGGVLTLGLFQLWGEVWPRWALGLRGCYYYRTRGACRVCGSTTGWPSQIVGASR